MNKEAFQPSNIETMLTTINHELDEVRKVFAEMYALFEKSGFDTLVLANLQKEINKNKYIKESADISKNYWWRMFLEYALFRIPDDKITVRNLLIERVRNNWHEHRASRCEKYINEKMKAFQGVIDNSMRNVFNQLVSYGILAERNFYEDGTSINNDIEGSYDFGNVRDGVLTWKKDANELANAIYHIWLVSSYEGQRSYDIILQIASFGKIKLQYCKWQTVQDRLGDLISQKVDGQKDSISLELTFVLTSILRDVLPVKEE